MEYRSEVRISGRSNAFLIFWEVVAALVTVATLIPIFWYWQWGWIPVITVISIIVVAFLLIFVLEARRHGRVQLHVTRRGIEASWAPWPRKTWVIARDQIVSAAAATPPENLGGPGSRAIGYKMRVMIASGPSLRVVTKDGFTWWFSAADPAAAALPLALEENSNPA